MGLHYDGPEGKLCAMSGREVRGDGEVEGVRLWVSGSLYEERTCRCGRENRARADVMLEV